MTLINTVLFLWFLGIFPEPNVDPIIQIANVIILHGEKNVLYRNIFTLKSCAPIGHAEVKSTIMYCWIGTKHVSIYSLEWIKKLWCACPLFCLSNNLLKLLKFKSRFFGLMWTFFVPKSLSWHIFQDIVSWSFPERRYLRTFIYLSWYKMHKSM